MPHRQSLFTPAARAPSSRLKVPSRLAVWLVRGSLTERGTEGRAAWWRMTSTPSQARAVRFGVAQIALDKLKAAGEMGEVFAQAGFEVVEAANRFSALDEGLRNPGADETGAAGNQETRHVHPS